MSLPRRYLPLAVFVVLLGFLGVGLGLKPRELPSALVGRPAPDFRLPRLDAPQQTVSAQQLRGQVWLLNVWASWCTACREEHATLVELASQRIVPVYGLNYKDGAEAARGWLARHGNPYVASLADADGRTGMDFGVYGVPETFVIDGAGIVRHRFSGPLTPQAVREVILPLVAQWRSGAAERVAGATAP